MKIRNALILLLTAPLLVGCQTGSSSSSRGGHKGGTSTTTDPVPQEIDFEKTAEPLDVDNIDVGSLTKDTFSTDIKVEDGKAYFDFYEISDFHGAVNYESGSTIGLSRMATYFNKKRSENPGGTILLSSGDMFQGSAESNLTRGYLVNYAMNIMGFESMTLGNHEFDWSTDWIKKNSHLKINDYSIPYLGANIFEKATGQLPEYLKASTIVERGEYKIGIIGTMGDGADRSIMKALVQNLEFKNEWPIVEAEAKRLKDEEHCDIVVWSSHRDAEDLSKVGVTKESGIDAVFGGHSHDNKDATSGDIPFLETKNYGKGIAHAQLALDLATKEVTCTAHEVDSKPYNLSGLTTHPEIEKLMAVYNEKLDPIKNEVIGSTDETLNISGDFSLTNLCVETMAMAANKWGESNDNIKVVAAFHNANGGVRAAIEAGDIKFGDVYRSFPFDNEVVVVKTLGRLLKGYLLNANNHGFYYDVSLMPTRASLADNEFYYFTTTDFMATSKNFVFNLEEDELIRTGYVVRDVVAARVKSIGKIKKTDFTRYDNPTKFSVPN